MSLRKIYVCNITAAPASYEITSYLEKRGIFCVPP